MSSTLEITDQWSDFLVREFDQYSFTKYQILLDWLGDISGKKVLVVGCGSGELCALLTLKGAHVHACDIEEQNINLARATANKYKAQFTTEVASIESLDNQIKYDCVFATDVIEHIKDDVFAVTKLESFLNQNGILALTVPSFNFLMGYHDEVLGHYRRYSKSMIRKLLIHHFDILKLRYFGFFLIPITLLYSCWMRKPYPVASIGKSQRDKSLIGRLFDALLIFEKKINLGLGTSLLCIAKKSLK